MTMRLVSEIVKQGEYCDYCNTESLVEREYYKVIGGFNLDYEYHVRSLYCEFCDKTISEEFL